MKKICLYSPCNKEFSTEDKRQKYCCIKCAYADRKSNKVKIECEFCKKNIELFPSRINGQFRFCSKDCQINWQKLHREATKRRLAKVCLVCRKTFRPAHIRNIYCSDKCRLHDLNSTHYGETHPSWKGGVTDERRCLETTAEYQQWKKDVFKRDKYRCVICGSTHKIEAHHIKTFADFKELRMDLDNGITLCHEHHLKTYGKEEIYEPYFININTFLKSFYETAEPRIMLV